MNNISDAENASQCLGKWQKELTMHYVSFIYIIFQINETIS